MKTLICRLGENFAKQRCIGYPKTINYQQGKFVKIAFLGENENIGPSVFTQYLKIYKKQLSCSFTQIWIKNVELINRSI